MVISFGFMHIIYGCSVSLLDTLIRRVFTFLLAASVFRGKIVLRRVYQQQRFQTLRCHQFFVHVYIYMYICLYLHVHTKRFDHRSNIVTLLKSVKG